MALDAHGNEVGKLFVGGLHQSTNTNGLHNYFSKFGDIEESIVMMDNRTGRSRGFGYVKFKEPSAVDQVLSKKVHVIDNKEVDPKRCNINMRGKNKRSLKIFVGGIAFEHDEETIRAFFQCFGNVTDVNLLSSPGRPRHRGFAFVGFDDEEVVKKLIKMHFVNLHGKKVEIKPMEPPNTQKTFGYMPPGMFTTPNGRPAHGYPRFNSFHQHNIPYGGWNNWDQCGIGEGKTDLSTDENVGGNCWNQMLNHPGLSAWNSPPPPSIPNQWNESASSSSVNGCWESQMAAAAAAAAFQSNGFSSPQQTWGSQPSSGRRPPGPCFRGDVGVGGGGGGLDPTLLDYSSWTPPAQNQHQQHHGGASHLSNHLQSSSDPFSRRLIGGAGGDDSHFASAWNTAVTNDGSAQWSGDSLSLWSGGPALRNGQSDSINGPRLAGVLGLNSNPNSSVFRMDDSLYRTTSAAGVNGVTAGGGGGLGAPEVSAFPTSETPTPSDWQSTAAAVAAAAAQQRSLLAAAAAAAASQMKR